MRLFYERFLVGFMILTAGLTGCRPPAQPESVLSTKAALAPPTFNAHVAPIIYEHCASCHRPGQSGPFPLTDYSEVRKRGKQIVEVTASGFMPPWLPEPGYGNFEGERRLTDEQIRTLERWVQDGMPEGDDSNRPRLPSFVDGWHLGEPDWVAGMPKPYELQADGKDVYRNFVIPVGLDERRYVKAVELRPKNLQAVHHAFVKVDRTRESRDLDAADPLPGFEGMNIPASMPGGQFLSWQPGKIPSRLDERYSWTLDKGADLVLQMHLRPTGKPELVDAEVGFHFAGKPPEAVLFKMHLTSLNIDIPAGEDNYSVRDEFMLPVDAEALGVLPHAHYLAQDMKGYAILPGGTRKWLIWIKQWDFNWQGDYRFSEPVVLPKGTVIHMDFTYDNSSENVFNPNHPPRRVVYGGQSTDEMAELWLQLKLKNDEDAVRLSEAYESEKASIFAEYYRGVIEKNPGDYAIRAKLAMVLSIQGRHEEAMQELAEAVKTRPDYARAFYQMGLIYRVHGQAGLSMQAFGKAVRIDPGFYKAHGNLGILFMDRGDFNQASNHLARAIALYPNDALAHENLAHALYKLGHPEKAAEHFQTAHELNPDNAAAKANLEKLRTVPRSKNN